MISDSIKLRGDSINTLESQKCVTSVGFPVPDELKEQLKLLMEIFESNEGRV